MNIFTVTVVIMIMISTAVFVSVRHFGRHEMTDRRNRYTPFLLLLDILVVASDMIAGGAVALRLPSDLILSLSSMLLLLSSLWEEDTASGIMVGLVTVQSALLSYYVLVAVGVLPMLSACWFVRMACICAVLVAFLFLTAIHLRIREVRLVIRHGNVWSSLCTMVDMVYVLFILIYAFVLTMGMSFGVECAVSVAYPVSILLSLEFGALGIRVAEGSVFVICSRHERRIVESMKISQMELSADSSKGEEMYRTIYERLVHLFEDDRLYLNSELTINDIVKIVYTNKLYISRAISQFTGRNFCQFVNYYRVIHSIRLFRENPDLKVSELANQSGFNSSVTFAMAFRLYMSESPSDWCRKERYKIKGKKK